MQKYVIALYIRLSLEDYKYDSTLCISLVGVYENILQKVFDPLSQYHCSVCQSKKLSIDGDDSDEDGMVKKLYLRCEECGATTEVVFEGNDGDNPTYTTGKVVE